MKRTIACILVVGLVGPGCWGFRHGGLGLGLFRAAVVTAVIVSAVQPPPPQVVVVPPPQEGYVWQPGYWTQQDGQWVWTAGGWVEARPAARFVPTHWEQTPDGQWQLVPAQWVGDEG